MRAGEKSKQEKKNSTLKVVHAMAKKKITFTLLSNTRKSKSCDSSPLSLSLGSGRSGQNSLKDSSFWSCKSLLITTHPMAGKRFACSGGPQLGDKLQVIVAGGLVTYRVVTVVQSLSCVLHFCDPMDCSQPSSSVHGIPQARRLAWVAISFFRGFSWVRDWTHVSCTGRLILYHWTTGEARHTGRNA